MKINQAQLVSTLLEALESNPEVLITFVTRLGNDRVMRCTKQLESIPESQHEARYDSRLNGDTIITVYDFQNSGWRCVPKNSILSFEVK